MNRHPARILLVVFLAISMSAAAFAIGPHHDPLGLESPETQIGPHHDPLGGS